MKIWCVLVLRLLVSVGSVGGCCGVKWNLLWCVVGMSLVSSLCGCLFGVL